MTGIRTGRCLVTVDSQTWVIFMFDAQFCWQQQPDPGFTFTNAFGNRWYWNPCRFFHCSRAHLVVDYNNVLRFFRLASRHITSFVLKSVRKALAEVASSMAVSTY